MKKITYMQETEMIKFPGGDSGGNGMGNSGGGDGDGGSGGGDHNG